MARRFLGVPWTNLIGVVESGEKLIKVSGGTGWNAGGDTRGVRTIPRGRDGYLEFHAETIAETGGPHLAAMGLSATGTGLSYVDIQFAVMFDSSQPDRFLVYEDGVSVYDGGAASLSPADVVRVNRIDGVIYYQKNGATQYTHAIAGGNATAPLYADAAFNEMGSSIVGWRFSIDELDEAAPICEALKGNAHLAVVVSVAFPSGTRRYSTSPISSATDGHYHQRLLDVGRISRSIGDRSYSLNTGSVTVTVADEDGSLVQLLATERAHWSAVTIRSASQSLPNADWMAEFTGRIDSWEQAVPVDSIPAVSLVVRNDDLALRSPTPDGTITGADYPSITPEALGASERQVYGRHHSQGIADQAGGTLEVLCVQPWDGATWRGYVASGIVRIIQVFVGAVAQTTIPTTWSAPVPVRGGRWLTEIVLTVDPGTEKVTVDCDGYDWIVDGSGWTSYAGGPEHWADVVRHWLANFVFNKWKAGGPNIGWYQPDPTQIDLASLSDVKLALGRVAAGRIVMSTGTSSDGTGKAAAESLNEACASVGVYPIFTREGRIGFVIDDPLVPAQAQYEAPLILAQRSGEMRASWPGEGISKRVVVSFAQSQAQGRYLGTHEISDPDVPNDSLRKLEAPWSPTMLLNPPAAIVLNDAAVDPVLALWLRGKTMLQDYNQGDSIGTVRDLSGLGHDWTQGTGGKQPKFRYYPQDERAWIEFDGSDDQLDALPAPLSGFKVVGGWTMLMAFRIRTFTAGARLWATSSGVCELQMATGPNRLAFVHNDGGADTVYSPTILQNVWYVACVRHVGGNIYIGINDARKLQMLTAASGNTTSLVGNVSLGGVGGSYAKVDVAEVIAFKDDAGENTLRAMDYMLAEHVFRYKSSILGANDMGSRYLQIYRRPRMKVTLDSPPELSVLELGKIIRVQHPLGSAPTVGWAASGPGSRPFRIVAMSRDSINNTLGLTLADVHDPCVIWRDTGITLRGVDTGKADWSRREGVARLG